MARFVLPCLGILLASSCLSSSAFTLTPHDLPLFGSSGLGYYFIFYLLPSPQLSRPCTAWLVLAHRGTALAPIYFFIDPFLAVPQISFRCIARLFFLRHSSVLALHSFTVPQLFHHLLYTFWLISAQLGKVLALHLRSIASAASISLHGLSRLGYDRSLVCFSLASSCRASAVSSPTLSPAGKDTEALRNPLSA